MARVADASASSVVTADVVALAAPIEGYLQYGKLAPGDLLDNIISSPRFTIRWWTIPGCPNASEGVGARRLVTSLELVEHRLSKMGHMKLRVP
jgi:hypothetical protein